MLDGDGMGWLDMENVPLSVHEVPSSVWLVGDQLVKRPASGARTRLAEDQVRAEISHQRQLLVTVTCNPLR